MKNASIHPITLDLLSWYDAHARRLPWRTVHPERPPLYHTVVSEMMLQQTTVATVYHRFTDFVATWPDFHGLSQASMDDVLAKWQGLGYYRRAHSLWKCAKILAYQTPITDKEWLSLPGFGLYTSAAVRSIALGHPIIAMDGNIRRILSRYFLEKDEKVLLKKAQILCHPTRSGDVNQALMDMGGKICLPRNPDCSSCPLAKSCGAYAQDLIHAYPPIKIKKAKPTKYVYAYVGHDDLAWALEKRQGSGWLQGGLMGLPLSRLYPEMPSKTFEAHVTHTFTHFHLKIHVMAMDRAAHENAYPHCIWVPTPDLQNYALPTLMKKIIAYKKKKDF